MSVRWLRQLRCIVAGLAVLASTGGECMGRPDNANDSVAAVADSPRSPAGANVWVLSGASIAATTATINGLAIDTGSVDSIARSAAAILASRGPDGVLSSVAANGPADMAIDFTAPGQPVSPLFHGFNLQWQSKTYPAQAKYRALVGQIRVDTLRFPGGQERGQFDPEASSSTRDDLGHDGVYQFRLTGEDVRHYIALCREQGIEAQIEVNMTNDDPAMAVRLIDYVVNTLTYDLKYVSMGNEPEIDLFDSWKY